MRSLRWMAALLLFPSIGLAAEEAAFEFKPVVDGVYVAVSKKRPIHSNSNAAIVLLDDGVLVVDTNLLPSASRQVIAEIKKLTDKPVKYVVITHWHGDHSGGSSAYPTEYPGVKIISSEATRTSMEQRQTQIMNRELVTIPRRIEGLKGELEKASGAAQKQQIEGAIHDAEAYVAELKEAPLALATLAIDHTMIIHDKLRTVEILILGKAHTDGDVFVYLPREKLVYTGDALLGGMPNMRDGYPFEWIHTLDELEKLDIDYIVPGHGDVMRGKDIIELYKQYITDVLNETGRAFAAGATLDEAKRRIVPAFVDKYRGKFPANLGEGLETSAASAVEKAFRERSGTPPRE